MHLEIENILQKFPIDVKSTKYIPVEGLKKGTTIFKVHFEESGIPTKDMEFGDSFIIDSFSGIG